MEHNNESPIEVNASFNSPVEQLYAAWTQPEQLKQWWKTTGHQLTDVTNDLKQGGVVKYSFENNELEIEGKYETVEENKELVYTWTWHFANQENNKAEHKLHVRFKSTNTGSSISITQEELTKQEHIHPHKEGWEKGLQDLKNFLEKVGNTKNDSNRGEGSNEGYREDPEQVKVGGTI